MMAVFGGYCRSRLRRWRGHLQGLSHGRHRGNRNEWRPLGPAHTAGFVRVRGVPGPGREPACARRSGRGDRASVPPPAASTTSTPCCWARETGCRSESQTSRRRPRPGRSGTWGRAADNPVGGWYRIKNGLRGRLRQLRAAGPRGPRSRRAGAQRSQQPGASPMSALRFPGRSGPVIRGVCGCAEGCRRAPLRTNCLVRSLSA